MTGGADAPRQFCRVCGRDYALDSAFCVACGAKSPADPVIEAPADISRPPPAGPISREEADAALEEFRRRSGRMDILTGRSGGDVLSLDEGDLLSGEAAPQDDTEISRE